MSNRRAMLFFIVGILLMGGMLLWLELRSRRVAPDARADVLCALSPAHVNACFVRNAGRDEVELARGEDGLWRIVQPFSVAADAAAVARLVDALTLVPVTDMRSEEELLELDETLEDFGIGPSSFTVSLGVGPRRVDVVFGNVAPSGAEVYAHVEGTRSVCALPRAAFDRIPRGVDDFRERGVLACPRDEISGIDIRVPDKPAVRLARTDGGWSILSPAATPADGDAVGALVDCLAAAQVEAFEIPSRTRPMAPSGGIKTDDLVQYGLDAGLSVTVRGAADYTEQIVFGRSAGTNLVWALVRNGTAVVSVDAALAERCRADGASLRDTRVFPFAEGETVTSVSLTAGPAVYVLAQDSNSVWRIEAPVVAPADQTKVVEFMERLLRLRQSDVSDEGRAGDERVLVSVSTTVTNRPGLAVSAELLGGKAALADLRSKTLLALDPATVRRLSVRAESGVETSVRLNVERGAWDLVRGEGSADARRVNDGAVKALLSALARVEAAGVETLAATADDLRRCGLDKPAFVLAVDVDAADAVRQNVLIGGTAPGGGRYATVGGADAVFVISRRTAADFTAPLAE